MVQEGNDAGIDAVVRSANGHWRRIGVPRRVRRRWKVELQEQLEVAVADGGRARDVVGADVWAFAAEWAKDRDHRLWADFGLSMVAVVLVVLGLLPLLDSLTGGSDGSRTVEPATLSAAVILPLGLSLLFRAWHRLSGLQTGLLAIATFVAYTVAFGVLAPGAAAGEVLLPVPLAGALVALGLAVTGAGYGHKLARLR